MKKPPLIPALIFVAGLMIVFSVVDYYDNGKQGWLTAAGAAPAALLIFYYVVAGLVGWARDLKAGK